MKLIVNEVETVVVEFTRDEIEQIASLAAYVADEFLRDAVDREALDGHRMTSSDATRLDNELYEIATGAFLRDPDLRRASRERAVEQASVAVP